MTSKCPTPGQGSGILVHTVTFTHDVCLKLSNQLVADDQPHRQPPIVSYDIPMNFVVCLSR